MNLSKQSNSTQRLFTGTGALIPRSSDERLARRCRELMETADVQINGSRPWDIRVNHQHFYRRVLAEGSLGLGESYMDGWWDCPSLDGFFYKILRAGLDSRVFTWTDTLAAVKANLLNLQKISRAFQIGEHHYDLGNELYRLMLDKRMVYSCGYWSNADTLDQAQEAKLELICRKLELKPGMRLLDIGCGWGGMAAYAAEKYGVSVVGITVSKEQASLAKEKCAGLPVSIIVKDYRSMTGEFDRIVSIGMFEHVGQKNYRRFMECQKRLLAEDGLVMLHTIGRNKTGASCDKWISRYIFPNSMLPSMKQISAAAEGLFVIEDWHNFGIHYDITLMHWFENFDKHFSKLKSEKYDDRFYRMWKYYLLCCAGSFRARRNHVWQVVLSPKGCVGGYQAPR
jgi:cyclopropane-fatty-acyl-phospholipid synthase